MGDHVRLWTDGDAGGLCAGTLEYLDGYVGQLKAIHGGVPELTVNYYWYTEDPGDVHEICTDGEDVVACAVETSVFSTEMPDEHELVHAVRHGVGRSHPFFEEGAAELWGPAIDRDFAGELDVMAGIEAAGSDGSLPLGWYPLAGRFSAWVAAELGVEAVVDIAQRSSPQDDADAAANAFAEATGLSLDAAIEAFNDAAWNPGPCKRNRYRDDGPSCAVAKAFDCGEADDLGRIDFTIDLRCGAPGVVGPRNEEVWTDLTFELTSPQSIPLVFDDPLPEGAEFGDYGEIEVRNCGVGCDSDARSLYLLTPGDVPDAVLAPGRYLVRIKRRLGAPTDDFISISGFIEGACP